MSEPPKPLTIWTNYYLPPAALELVRQGIGPHRLAFSANMQTSNLSANRADDSIRDADVIYGQPDPAALLQAPNVKWVHLTSAGYDRYDRPDLRAAFKDRGAVMTNSSSVYDEPCAQHALAMMLTLSRQLPQCQDDQRSARDWNYKQRRIDSYLLAGQTVVTLSYGAIARRLIEMLQPFGMKVYAVRREVRGDESVQTVSDREMDKVLPLADHVVNILPGGPETKRVIDEARFARMKPGAVFYNIGRGTTVDQDALLAALDSGQIRYAYLDVTDPEPLPPAHPLWSHPRCFITPHTAGGTVDEFERLARHFLGNLDRFTAGKPLLNRVI
jgi:phosphoglycerate dehydrogenase-like enzyme